MASRSRIPQNVEFIVLTKSARRCALCFGLRNDLEEKRGQIAHVDGDPANNNEENLVFLCLEHHDEYDSVTSQSKGITESELKAYRNRLYAQVECGLLHDKQVAQNPVSADIQFISANLFSRESGGNFNIDISVHNPSDRIIDITGFKVRFIGIRNPIVCAWSIRKVSAKYLIRHEGNGLSLQIEDSPEKYEAYAWYPTISSDRTIVKGALFQSLRSGESDRFQIMLYMPELPMKDHHKAKIILEYVINCQRSVKTSHEGTDQNQPL